MLRALLLLFLVANAVLWAYGQGWLASVGWSPQDHREPQRLAQQVAPEALRLLPPEGDAQLLTDASPAMPPDALPKDEADGQAAASTAATAAPATAPTATPAAATTPPTACWQVAGLPAAAGPTLREALARVDGLAASAWALEAQSVPARWIVYLGPFANADAQQQRRNALRTAGVDVRTVTTAGLQPGLALGTYSTQEAAQRALRDAGNRGVRDAKVVQERPESQTWSLRLPAVNNAQRDRVQALSPLAGQPLQPCP